MKTLGGMSDVTIYRTNKADNEMSSYFELLITQIIQNLLARTDTYSLNTHTYSRGMLQYLLVTDFDEIFRKASLPH